MAVTAEAHSLLAPYNVRMTHVLGHPVNVFPWVAIGLEAITDTEAILHAVDLRRAFYEGRMTWHGWHIDYEPVHADTSGLKARVLELEAFLIHLQAVIGYGPLKESITEVLRERP